MPSGNLEIFTNYGGKKFVKYLNFEVRTGMVKQPDNLNIKQEMIL